MVQFFQIQKRNYLCDIFIGILIGMPFGAIIVLTNTNAFVDDVFPIIKDYQTLLAGLLASGVALISIGRLNRQLKQAQQFREDDRARQLAASKLTLPVALDAFRKYAEESLLLTVDMCKGLETEQDLPSFDAENFAILATCAEYAAAADRERLREIVRLYNSQHFQLARFLKHHEPEDVDVSSMNEFADKRALQMFGVMSDILNILHEIDGMWKFAYDIDDPNPLSRIESARFRLQTAGLQPNSATWGPFLTWDKFFHAYEHECMRRGDAS